MITFENAIEKRQLFENQSIHYSRLLNEYPHNSIGLVADTVRNSIEYKTLKDNYYIAVQNLKAINTFINKNYKKQYKQYIDNNRLYNS